MAENSAVYSSLWIQCARALEAELSEQQFNTWIRPLQLVEDGPLLKLLAPNRFVVDWVKGHCLEQIRAWWTRHGDGAPRCRSRSAAGRRYAVTAAPAARRARGAAGTPPLGSRLNKVFTFDSFVEGKSNQLARAAAFQVAQNPGSAYNPLFIYGGVGLGKTHLMHAIGNLIVARNPAAKVAYVHSERFVSDMVRGPAAQHDRGVQTHLPLARRPADRRHPVLRGQGSLAGRILPYIQRVARGPAADHPDLRSLSEGGHGSRGAAEVAVRLGSDGGDRAAGARDERRDPDEQGGRGARDAAGGGRVLHRAAHPLERSRARRRVAPRARELRGSRASRSRSSSPRKRCATCSRCRTSS